ncbi:alpha/beta hydrolase [Bacillus sp. S3]|uniref:alpha/beta fold hydrolase n=1 Tax=Bacillus sp. S3 TaxID=486398 RepID=UPI0011897888|nr:alpha/beta hydrolase [Bacillus sp. S3]QCJ44734.1 alpha/beta hydrolase [Bacillus sp. S3]
MSKTPLILLPGTLCNQRLWRHQIEHLSDLADITVGDLTTFPSVEAMASSILEHAPERFALAGLSLGGIVSLEIMRQAPERVIKLALLDTTAHPPKPEQIPAWNQLLRTAKEVGVSQVTEDYLLPNLIYQHHPEKELLTQTILTMAEEVGLMGYINQLKAVMTKPDGFEVLPAITCHTLLLVGREDLLCTVKMHQEMKERIPNAQLVILENCGHLSSLENPEAVTRAMRIWLSHENRSEGNCSAQKNRCKACCQTLCQSQ